MAGGPNIRRIKANASVRKQPINFNEVMQKSHGKAGEDRCPLRQKSLAQTSTTQNLSSNNPIRSNVPRTRTGLSATGASASTKQQKNAAASLTNAGLRPKAAMTKSDLSKLQALVRADRDKLSPLREKSPQPSARNHQSLVSQEAERVTSVVSDARSKSVPKSGIKGSKSGPVHPGYEPMRHQRP